MSGRAGVYTRLNDEKSGARFEGNGGKGFANHCDKVPASKQARIEKEFHSQKITCTRTSFHVTNQLTSQKFVPNVGRVGRRVRKVKVSIGRFLVASSQEGPEYGGTGTGIPYPEKS